MAQLKFKDLFNKRTVYLVEAGVAPYPVTVIGRYTNEVRHPELLLSHGENRFNPIPGYTYVPFEDMFDDTREFVLDLLPGRNTDNVAAHFGTVPQPLRGVIIQSLYTGETMRLHDDFFNPLASNLRVYSKYRQAEAASDRLQLNPNLASIFLSTY